MALNVQMENSFKDELDDKFGEDRGDRRSAHVDQPQILSGALCSKDRGVLSSESVKTRRR